MAHDLAVLLGAAVKDIRVRTSRTQDEWHHRTGMSQSYTSAVERGASGWDCAIVLKKRHDYADSSRILRVHACADSWYSDSVAVARESGHPGTSKVTVWRP